MNALHNYGSIRRMDAMWHCWKVTLEDLIDLTLCGGVVIFVEQWFSSHQSFEEMFAESFSGMTNLWSSFKLDPSPNHRRSTNLTPRKLTSSNQSMMNYHQLKGIKIEIHWRAYVMRSIRSAMSFSLIRKLDMDFFLLHSFFYNSNSSVPVEVYYWRLCGGSLRRS